MQHFYLVCCNSILFNIYLNDWLSYSSKGELRSFADGDTISAFSKDRNDSLKVLKSESELAINWFRQNKMIVNFSKFQSKIKEKTKTANEIYKFNILTVR